MKKLIAVLLSLVLCFSLVACSDDKKEETSAPAEKGAEASPKEEAEKEVGEDAEKSVGDQEVAQGVTDTTIKIGNSIAVSGALSVIGQPIRAGILAYIEMVNEEGGINGRTIEYIHIDDEFKPELGLAAFEELVYDEEVFALVGHMGTPIVAATLPDIIDTGIPVVYFTTGLGALYNENATDGNGRNCFPVQPVYPLEGRLMAGFAKSEFDAKTIGVVHTNDEAGMDLLEAIKKEGEGLGMTVMSESLAADSTDATAQISKLKDCDIFIAATIQAVYPIVIKELEKQGVMKPVLTSYVNVDAKITENNKDHVTGLLSDPEAGIYGLGYLLPDTSTEEWATFIKYMEQVGEGDLANTFGLSGWVAAHYFVEGLRRVGDDELSWDNYMSALEESPVKTPFGGEIDFSNGQRLGSSEMFLQKMDPSVELGWTPVSDFKGLAELTGN